MKKLLLSMMMVVAAATASAQYKVGDIYNKDSVKGIVVTVSDDGAHGMLMSLDCASERWSDGKLKMETSALDEIDGTKNMAAIEKYVNENGKEWKDFSLFEWANELGDGWYIPSISELLEMMKGINGNSMEYNAKTFAAFDKLIKKAKGKAMISKGNLAMMYSSTETGEGLVYVSNIAAEGKDAMMRAAFGGKQKGKIAAGQYIKNAGMGTRSRAVHKF